MSTDVAPHRRCIHARPLCAGARRRRRDCRRHPDDRARADAHLLGDDVLPLRVPRDLDRAVRAQRERRLRLRHAPHVRHALDGEPARRRIRCCSPPARCGARRSRAHPRRPQLLAREPRQDDRHLHARRPAVLLRRRRHLAGDHAPQEARQHRLWRRSHRRRARLPVAAAPVESLRRAGRRAPGRSARRRRSIAVFAGQDAVSHGGDRRTGRGNPRRPAADGIGSVRRQQHQRARRRHGPVREVEFVLARGGVRPVARRLVAQLALQGRQARNAIHGHRFGGVDADPALRRRSVEGRISEIRAHRARLSPHGTDPPALRRSSSVRAAAEIS